MPDYTSAVERNGWEKHGERPSILDYSAKADCVFLTDAAIDASDNTLTSALAAFVTADAGKACWVEGAGGAGVDLLTTIASVTDANTVELTAPALATVADADARYGTDNTAAIQAAFDEANNSGQGWTIRIPRGAYLTTGSLTPYHQLTIVGEMYTQRPTIGGGQTSEVVCCANVPAINYASNFRLEGFGVDRLVLRGTTRSGSKGIYIQNSYGTTIRHCSFDTFGDHAIHLEAEGGVDDNPGTDCYIDHVFAQNCMLVTAGRTDYVGVLDVAVHDWNISYVMTTSSTDADGDGYIAAVAARSTQGFGSDWIAHHSEVGAYIEGSFHTLVNCRADQNYAHGFVVAGSGLNFLGCRAHANSKDTTGTYDAFTITGAGNRFQGCQVTDFGPAYWHHRDAFRTENDDTTASNHFTSNYITATAYEGQDYNFNGSQDEQVATYPSNIDVPGRKTQVIRGDLLIREDQMAIWKAENEHVQGDEALWSIHPNYSADSAELGFFVASDDFLHENPAVIIKRTGYEVERIRLYGPTVQLVNPDAPADDGTWNFRSNIDPASAPTYQQLLLAAANDAGAESIAMRVGRDAGVVQSVDFPTGLVQIYGPLKQFGYLWLDPGGTGTDKGAGTGYLEFGGSSACICYRSGSPEGQITAAPSSVCHDYANGLVYVKESGTGNTGWAQLNPGLWTLVDAHNIATAYRVSITDTDDLRPMSLAIVPNAHANQSSTYLLTITAAFHVDYLGSMQARSLGVNYAEPSTAGHVHINGFVAVGAQAQDGSETLRNTGASLLEGNVELRGLTASLPLKVDANKDVVSEKINLGAAADVTLSGSAGQYLRLKADGSVEAVSAATVLSDIGASTSTHTHDGTANIDITISGNTGLTDAHLHGVNLSDSDSDNITTGAPNPGT